MIKLNAIFTLHGERNSSAFDQSMLCVTDVELRGKPGIVMLNVIAQRLTVHGQSCESDLSFISAKYN